MAPLLQVEGLAFRYPEGGTALAGLTFAVAPGERLVVVGANGSGKSTLLKCLDALLWPTAGRIAYDATPLTRGRLRRADFRRRFRTEVALLFQDAEAMLFHPVVAEEIAFGPRQQGLPEAQVAERVARWAEAAGVTGLLERTPSSLSGGEKKRVALACCLALEPRLLLLDEPTAGLDPPATGRLVDLLLELPAATVAATHNLSLAPELGDRCLLLGPDHTLLADGPAGEILTDPHLLRSARLLHTHRHRHGPTEHRHYHAHDWE